MANRLVRDGWRTAQTSNAYLLVPAGAGTLPTIPAKCCGGQSVRETPQIAISTMPASSQEVADAHAALARRRAAVEGRLLTRGAV
jgi:hypothetical protein